MSFFHQLFRLCRSLRAFPRCKGCGIRRPRKRVVKQPIRQLELICQLLDDILNIGIRLVLYCFISRHQPRGRPSPVYHLCPASVDLGAIPISHATSLRMST